MDLKPFRAASAVALLLRSDGHGITPYLRRCGCAMAGDADAKEEAGSSLMALKVQPEFILDVRGRAAADTA